MNSRERQFLEIKNPELLKELEDYLGKEQTEQNAGKDDYIRVLARAGKGMHIDAICAAVHSVEKKKGSDSWKTAHRRTTSWLHQNDVAEKVKGVAEKVKMIGNKATPATYKLTEAAKAAFQEQAGAQAIESDEGDEPPTISTAASKGKGRELANA